MTEHYLPFDNLDDLLAQDIFDTRDLIALIEHLEGEISLADNLGQHDEVERLKEELAHAQEFADDLDGYAPDFHYGGTVIADRYFVDYARELADDIGAVASDGGWPTYCIDWEWAARELQFDYTCLRSHDGRDWWVR